MRRRCIPLNKLFFRRERSEKKEPGILRLLLPSVLGFALCFVCLATATWAWFTISVTSAENTIQAATFTVSATVVDGGGNEVDFDNLSPSEYTVTVAPNNGASEGFVIITVTELPEMSPAVSYIYHTQQIPSGKMLNFTLDLSNISQNATTFKVEFTPHWGNADYYASTEDIGSPLSGTLIDKPALMMLMNDSDEEEAVENPEKEAAKEETENPDETDEDTDQDENADNSNPDETQGEGEGESETPDDTNSGNEGDDSDTGDSSNAVDSSSGDGENAGEDTGNDSDSGNDGASDSNTETGSADSNPAGSADTSDVSSEPVTDNADTASSETTQTDATASVEKAADTDEESPSV